MVKPEYSAGCVLLCIVALDVTNENLIILFYLTDNLTCGWQETRRYFLQTWLLMYQEKRSLLIRHIFILENYLVSYCIIYTVDRATLFFKMCQLKDSVLPLMCKYIMKHELYVWLREVLIPCGVQGKQAHCPMVLWLMGALRASLEHTKEHTMLSLQSGT